MKADNTFRCGRCDTLKDDHKGIYVVFDNDTDVKICKSCMTDDDETPYHICESCMQNVKATKDSDHCAECLMSAAEYFEER